jgi:nucleoside-diphosphate-sugar epimerase
VIIGKGMVAHAFKDLSGWEDDVLFAAGVSNSGEQDEKAYQKETELVKLNLQKLKSPARFVYFSTTSIFDPSKSGNFYIRHKLFVEDLIRNSNVNYLILRLPNLVGRSNNPNTLTNFFASAIKSGRKIKLNSKAIRHLIDVSDLSVILNDIIKQFGRRNLTVNVDTDKPLTAGEILSLLEEVLKKKAYIEPVFDDGRIHSIAEDKSNSSENYLWKTGENYHMNLLKKYYSI